MTLTAVISKLRYLVDYILDGTVAVLRVAEKPIDALSTLTTLQNAAAAVGDGTLLNMKAFKGLLIEITGTFTATVTFEATIDDTNWFAVGLKTAADGAAVTSATAPGAFKLPNDVTISQFRARISAFTLGAVTVKARRMPR